MAHEQVKQLLERATNELERADAIRQAILAGMPLAEIETYLDWLDAVRAQAGGASSQANSRSPGGNEATGGAQQSSSSG
jgi:hypothetical protein